MCEEAIKKIIKINFDEKTKKGSVSLPFSATELDEKTMEIIVRILTRKYKKISIYNVSNEIYFNTSSIPFP